RFNQSRRGLELGRLACQLLAAIVLREGDFQGAGFARRDTDQLVLEAGNEGIRADRHRHVFAGAAFEWRAVDRTLEGDRDPISGFSLGALALGSEAAVLLGDTLDSLVALSVGHVGHRLL